ncbi:hypothetical protein [Macellibacteroides fermentans]|uniref:hypothetical protein n=1 Tax=Macellibacteroides fermentans TaxID=879969 RepID=UPI00406CD9E8
MTALIFPFVWPGSCHTEEPIKKVFADKGYFGKPNREFLSLNNIEDGIMRKATAGVELTEYESVYRGAILWIKPFIQQGVSGKVS